VDAALVFVEPSLFLRPTKRPRRSRP
jgi:hypothetical protein